MSDTTLDEASKHLVKSALIRHVLSQRESLQENVQTEDAATRLDQESSFSVDDQSQSDEAGDLSGLFQEAIARQQADLQLIEQLDFRHRDDVGPGAIVGFGGNRYVVGVVTDPFDCEGVTYEGISTDAPIYLPIDGLRVGDSFTFRDREHRIDFVA